MRNITQDIKKAIATNVAWRVNEFYLFLDLAAEEGIASGFEEGVENWAVLTFNNVIIAYTWSKSPLLLIVSDAVDNLATILNECSYIVPIVVNSLGEEELFIDYDQDLVDRLGPCIFDTPVSAGDIWLSSVT